MFSESKNIRPVICEKQLNFTLLDGKVIQYEHRATVSHTGIHSSLGHYVAYRRSENDKCFKIDDAEVRQVEAGEIFDSIALTGGGPDNETPYILIYDQIS